MIYTSGWPDYDEMHFVRRYLRPGDGFVDVGANIGIFTLLAARYVGPHGRVLALEASRRAFQRLTENVALNQLGNSVEPRFLAVGPESGTVQFLQQHDLINRLVVPADHQAPDSRMEEVPCVTLDELLGGGSFAMGKIDIEGAELLAFRGGERILEQGNPPVWLLELKGRLLVRFGHSPEDVAGLLHRHRFRLAVYEADTNRLAFPPTPWQTHGNVLAIHESQIEHVERRLSESVR
jgi:FkbM family methyltransferase